MATHLGRWKCATSLIGARDDAYLPSIVDAPVRTHDAAPRTLAVAPRRPRDQEEPEAGKLLCRLSQHGTTGEWSGTDCDNRPLTLVRGADGTYEVRYAPAGEENPDRIAQQAPGARDASFEQRMSAALSPSGAAADHGPARVRGYAELLRQHYARRP
jgi:hypothetical protein